MSVGIVKSEQSLITTTGQREYDFDILYFQGDFASLKFYHETVDAGGITTTTELTYPSQIDFIESGSSINSTTMASIVSFVASLDEYRVVENINRGIRVFIKSGGPDYLTGGKVILRRVSSQTQNIDFQGVKFPAKVVEGAFDKVYFILQELQATIDNIAGSEAFTDALRNKLNGIEELADVTDEVNVKAALDGMSITAMSSGALANDDWILVQNRSSGDSLSRIDVSTLFIATADLLKSAYESNADTNALTDLLLAKLNGIEAGAEVNPTGAEIKTAYQAEANAYTDTKDTKLAGIEAGAEVNPTGAEIKTAYQAEANAYNDTKDTKLTGIEAGAEVNAPRATAGEITAGTETAERSHSPADIKSYIDQHGGSGGSGEANTASNVGTSTGHQDIFKQKTGDDLEFKGIVGGNGLEAVDVGDSIVVQGIRNLTTDGAKLDTIETNADVTDEANVKAAIDGMSLVAISGGALADDWILVQDRSTGDALTRVSANTLIVNKGAEIKTAYEAEANAYTDTKDTKLSGIEAGADVTDEANVKSALDGSTLADIGTPVAGDKILIKDTSDSGNLKEVDFSEFGGGGGGAVDSVNGNTGVVFLDADDIDDTSTAHKFATAAQLTKLDAIEAGADVTDETNVKSALNGATLTDIGTPVAGDMVLIQDASDSSNLKKVNFSEFGGGGGGGSSVFEVVFQARLSANLTGGVTGIVTDMSVPQADLVADGYYKVEMTIDYHSGSRDTFAEDFRLEMNGTELKRALGTSSASPSWRQLNTGLGCGYNVSGSAYMTDGPITISWLIQLPSTLTGDLDLNRTGASLHTYSATDFNLLVMRLG